MDHSWRRLSRPLSRRAGSLFRHHRLGLYLLAVLVGLASGLGAVLFRMRPERTGATRTNHVPSAASEPTEGPIDSV